MGKDLHFRKMEEAFFSREFESDEASGFAWGEVSCRVNFELIEDKIAVAGAPWALLWEGGVRKGFDFDGGDVGRLSGVDLCLDAVAIGFWVVT